MDDRGRRRCSVSDQWQYQIRIYLSDSLAEVARMEPNKPVLAPLTDILRKHGATMKCHYDAFADYVAEAERQGVEKFPLYKWTKVTIEDPEKKAKHLKIFTLHVGDDEIYPKKIADGLEADLQPLVDGGLITRLSKHDTNPANNPQVPAHLR
jgi:hypothetical protein